MASPTLPSAQTGRVDLALCVAGQAGDGIVTTGQLLQRLLFQLGYHVSTAQTLPSRIRGGATALTLRVTTFAHTAPAEALDLLVAFEPEAVKLHGSRLKEGGLLLFDPGRGPLDAGEEGRGPYQVVELTLRARAKALCGKDLYKAGGAVGAVAALLDLPREAVAGQLERSFGHREAALAANQKMAEEGHRLLAEGLSQAVGQSPPLWPLEARRGAEERLLLSANQAIALGALAAGCRFVAGYPITPATQVLTLLARHLPGLGGKVVQAEDELAAVNLCTGAAWGGARALTCTSGPGLSLMAEGLGFASNCEVGFVVVDCQRPGPSTGMPTRTEQGDLDHAVYGGHGSFERIVLSPADPAEAFYLTAEAFNLADEYQCPVLLLTQQYLAQNSFTVDKLDYSQVELRRGALLPLEPLEPEVAPSDNASSSLSEDAGVNVTPMGWYPRYALTDSGVSPRVLPGTPGGIHMLNANEHGPSGHISYAPRGRTQMVAKRARKLEPLRQSPLTAAARVEGDVAAPTWLVGWGATYGPLAEAVAALAARSAVSGGPGRAAVAAKGHTLAHLHLRQLWPLPTTALEETLGQAEKVIVVENNQTGQLAGLLRGHLRLGAEVVSVLRYDGHLYTGPDLVERILAVL